MSWIWTARACRADVRAPWSGRPGRRSRAPGPTTPACRGDAGPVRLRRSATPAPNSVGFRDLPETDGRGSPLRQGRRAVVPRACGAFDRSGDDSQAASTPSSSGQPAGPAPRHESDDETPEQCADQTCDDHDPRQSTSSRRRPARGGSPVLPGPSPRASHSQRPRALVARSGGRCGGAVNRASAPARRSGQRSAVGRVRAVADGVAGRWSGLWEAVGSRAAHRCGRDQWGVGVAGRASWARWSCAGVGPATPRSWCGCAHAMFRAMASAGAVGRPEQVQDVTWYPAARRALDGGCGTGSWRPLSWTPRPRPPEMPAAGRWWPGRCRRWRSGCRGPASPEGWPGRCPRCSSNLPTAGTAWHGRSSARAWLGRTAGR